MSTITQEADEGDAKWKRACTAFHELRADYLEAQAKLSRPGKSDKQCDDLTDAVTEITWRLIHTRALGRRSLDFKLDVMRGILKDGFPDGGAIAMLESIRSDIKRRGRRPCRPTRRRQATSHVGLPLVLRRSWRQAASRTSCIAHRDRSIRRSYP